MLCWGAYGGVGQGAASCLISYTYRQTKTALPCLISFFLSPSSSWDALGLCAYIKTTQLWSSVNLLPLSSAKLRCVVMPMSNHITTAQAHRQMLTPLHWVWNGPLALGWVMGSALVFPLLRKCGLVSEPNELDFTNDMRGKTIIVTGKSSPPFPPFRPQSEVYKTNGEVWKTYASSPPFLLSPQAATPASAKLLL